MYQDSKFSRFLFHLKFSQTDDFVHEHELYEVMRSRNLYQTQFGVRSNFKTMMKNLAKDEKQRRYGFENTRKLFVQRMKERREQTDKLRNRTTDQLKSLSTMQDKKQKLERRYVPKLQSTIVYTTFPPIESIEQEEIIAQPLSQEANDKPHEATLHLPTPLPSVVATFYTDEVKAQKEIIAVNHDETRLNPFYKANVLVVGKTGPQTLKTTLPRSSKDNIKSDTVGEFIEHDLNDQLKILKLEQGEQEDTSFNADYEFEQKTKLGEGKAQLSTVYFTDDLPSRLKLGQAKAIQSTSKVWTEKQDIIESQDDIRKESDHQKFLIDRPSKWANHGSIVSSKLLDIKLQYSRRMLNESFRKKSRHLDHLSEKLMFKHRISLPELNTAPKPMASIDPGGTTPDGKLILTKADYEEYLSGYRKARDVRLEKCKKRNRFLEKRIDNFRLEPELCLSDETCLRTSLKTI